MSIALAINPQAPDTLYAGTYVWCVQEHQWWSELDCLNTGLTNTYVEALAINPQTPDTLYAGT